MAENQNLRLVKATRENFWELMDLRVTEEQEDFVASNAISLAQAYADEHRLQYIAAF